MTTITIDNKQYELENLSESIKGQLNNLQFIDGELARLQAKGLILQTARASFSKALQDALQEADEAPNM